MKRKIIWIIIGIFILLLIVISIISFIYINSTSDAADIPLIAKIFSPVSYFMSSPPKIMVVNNTNRTE